MLISAVWAVGLVFYASRRKWQSRYILLAPIVFFTHITIYYSAVFLFSGSNLDQELFNVQLSFNGWSSGVTLHAVITLTFLSWAVVNLIRNCHENE